MHIEALIDKGSSLIEHSFSTRNIFLLGSVILTVVLTVLFLFGWLPLSVEYFAFYSLLLFLACLARPNWMFLLFIAFLPLEIVTVTPASFSFNLRPYQWVGGLLGIAVGIRFFTGRLKSHGLHWHPVDGLLLVLMGGVVLSGVLGQGVAIKQTLVIGSFLFLYFLSRLFLRTAKDVELAFLFFLVPASLCLLLGVVQNILFLHGADPMAVMPGRPNGTLNEPDWLGLFLLFVLLPVLFWLKQSLLETVAWWRLFLPWILLLLSLTTLILTVSRSAWLATLVAVGLFFGLAFFERGKGFLFRPALLLLQCFIITLGVALMMIETVPLTRFALMDRAGSTVSQDQVITIACDGTVAPPERVWSVDELPQYFCRHISLEEKAAEMKAGKLVTTTARPDPNVNIRKQIYMTVWETLKTHPIVGIGWGNIGPKLGIYERGASYNASNIFLELWLGGGLLALGAFIGFLMWVTWQVLYTWFEKQSYTQWTPLMLSLLGGFLVFNVFNAGLALGFIWVWLALFPLVFPWTQPAAQH